MMGAILTLAVLTFRIVAHGLKKVNRDAEQAAKEGDWFSALFYVSIPVLILLWLRR